MGTDTITATYSGDSNHSGSTGTLSGGQVVNKATTSISVTGVTPASEAFGQDAQATITAILSWSGSGAAPTASDVTIGGNGPSSYGTTSCGSPSGTTMTCTAKYTPTSADTAGSYTESASFSGDGNYSSSISSQTNNFTITSASAATTVTTSGSPSAYGSSVTFTATINGQYGQVKGRVRSNTVTGSVTWSANTGCGTTPVTSGNPGTATCTTSSLGVGTDTITATYSGDSNHSGSTGTLSGGQVVNKAASAISVTNVNPSSETYGQDATVTITAVLSWSGSGSAPTAGDVIIGGNGPSSYGITSCGSATGNTITCTNTYTPTSSDADGSYTESASFSGDGNYSSSSSSQTGNFAITSATSNTAVTSSQNPSAYGQSVTFTATISGENGQFKGRVKKPTVTGTVSWSSNTGCGTTNVTSGNPGVATCTTSSLAVGNDTITANYSGDGNHGGSTGTLSGGQVVNSGTATSISVTSVTPSSEDYGADATVTITAVLSWTGGGAAPTASDVTIGGNGPSGYGTTNCGSPSGDTLTCTNTYTPTGSDTPGSYTESASFSGDGNYAASSSSQTNNFTINLATSNTAVSSSLNPSVNGQPVTFTATINGENGQVRGRAGKRPTVSGTVTWSSNTGCGTTNVTSGNPGVATCNTSTLPVGTDTITANYSGDGNHSGSTGTLSGGQVVTSSNQTITVTQAAPASAVYNSSFPVAATASSGLPVAITSSGACSGSGTSSASITMTTGTGTCSVNFNQAGNGTYTAAPQVTDTTNATKASQSITVTQSAPASAVYNSNFTVAATATSGLAVAYTSSGSCSNSSTLYTMTSGTGTCSVMFNQAGNSNYSAASQIAQSTNATPASQSITVTTPAPPTATLKSSFTVGASATSGLPVAFGSSGGCTNSGATYTMASTGKVACVVTMNQAGNGNYTAATQVTETVTVAAAIACGSNCTFTGAPASATYLSTFNVATTSGSNSSVPTIIAAGACTVSGNTVTMTKGTGTCTLTATWAANDVYSKTTIKQTTTAALGASVTTITSNTPNPSVAKQKVTIDFSVAQANSNPTNPTGKVTVTATTGETCSATLAAGTGHCAITFTTTGTRTLTATYAGSTNNSGSTSAGATQTVN